MQAILRERCQSRVAMRHDLMVELGRTQMELNCGADADRLSPRPDLEDRVSRIRKALDQLKQR